MPLHYIPTDTPSVYSAGNLASITNEAFLYPYGGGLSTVANMLKRFLEEENLGFASEATGGAKDYIADTDFLLSSRYQPDDLEGAYVRISTSTDGNAPEGEIRVIKKFIPEEGLIYVEPHFSTAPADGDTYQVWFAIHPTLALSNLNAVLRDENFYPSIAFLTDLPDGDMEYNAQTYWTNVGGINSAETGKTINRGGGLPFMGKRYLTTHLTNGQTTGYVESKYDMAVDAGMAIHLSALVMTNDHASAVAKLSLWDTTNNVELASKSVTRQLNIVRINLDTVTIPSSCRSVKVRLYNEQASGQTGPVRWDEVVMFEVGAKSIRCPTWVRDPNDVAAFIDWIDDVSYQQNLFANSASGRINPWFTPVGDAMRTGEVWAQSETGRVTRPMLVIAKRYDNEMSDTIQFDEELIVNTNYVLHSLWEKTFLSLANFGAASAFNTDMAIRKASFHAQAAANEKSKMAQRLLDAVPPQPMVPMGQGNTTIGAMNNRGFYATL